MRAPRRRSVLASLTVGILITAVAITMPPGAGGPLQAAGGPASDAPGASPFAVPASQPPPGQTIAADVVVYGATPSGILAAVSAARLGASVVLATPEAQVGGMMTSGLDHPDVGRPALIGGLTRGVFDRLRRAESRGFPGLDTAWNYEPHVALDVFDALLREAHVVVYVNLSLDRTRPPEMRGDRIVALRMTNDTRLAASDFIDATYEGDLMAAAGVPFTIGRESRAADGEPLAGVHVDEAASTPSLVAGQDAAGAPLPGVETGPIADGAADGLVQAATFRLCVTADPANRLAFSRPDGYDPAAYTLIGRAIDAIRRRTGATPALRSILSFASLPDGKADLNNSGLYSTDLVGADAAAWASASDAGRRAIFQEHRAWVAGLLWYLETDPAVASSLRHALDRWGLCADEFTATGGWPPELYVREARRMLGSVVLTERDLRQTVTKAGAIALGTYRIDAHYARRILGSDGLVRGDGELSASTRPYQIPYAAIVPPPGSVDNLIVSVTISATHVAWASIRTEPTLMEIGEAAGVAAGLAARDGVGVRAVDPAAIRAVLIARGGILAVPSVLPFRPWSPPNNRPLYLLRARPRAAGRPG